MRRGITLGGLATIVLTIVIFLPASLWLYGVPAPSFGKPVPPLPPITVLAARNDLATTNAHLSFPLSGSNNHYEIKYLIHGEILYGVDLSKAAYGRVDAGKMEAILRLPAPHMISCSIDHDRSEELYVKTISWFPTSDKQEIRAVAWKEAQHKLERLAQDKSYADHARTQAEHVLSTLFNGAGGWKLRFEWPDTTPSAVVTNP